MSNEDFDLVKSLEEKIPPMLDRAFNHAIDKAIEVVKDEQKEDWGYPADKALEAIINKLNKLKK